MVGVRITHGHGFSEIALEGNGGVLPLIHFSDEDDSPKCIIDAANDLRAYASALDAVAESKLGFYELADMINGIFPHDMQAEERRNLRRVMFGCGMCFIAGVSVGVSACLIVLT